ncbi:MAG: hypothetical protein KY464_13110 [Gemmatimonadetes bacterium]|nr:hypothetical protein [Gemmatimonadota bacterium]
MSLLRPAGLLFVALAAAGCERTAEAGEINHPTAENIPAEAGLADIIGAKSRAGGELQAFAERLAKARLVLTVGKLEGPPSTVFGAVEDVDVHMPGRFAVLDSRYNEVRVFDQNGTFIESFGRPGRGPTEFLAPEALESDGPDRFVVADRNAQVKVIERTPAGMQQRLTIPLQFTPEDLCVLGHDIVVQGPLPGGLLHLYSPDGRHQRTIGGGYQSTNALVRNQLSDGRAACSAKGQTIIAMLRYLPYVRGYGADGTLRWTSRLADFRTIKIEEGVEPDGQPYVLLGEGGGDYDQVEVLHALDDGLVIVQTARHTAQSGRERRDYAELHTYLLSAETGKGVYVGNTVPRVLDVAGNRIYTGSSEPFPQVRVYEIAPAGASS